MAREKVYTAIELHDRRGLRALLRVAAVPWRDGLRVHVREYYPSRDGRGFVPGRGVAFRPEHLETIIYALGLLAEDYERGLLEDIDGGPEEDGGEGADA